MGKSCTILRITSQELHTHHVKRENEGEQDSLKKILPVTKLYDVLKGGYYYKGNDTHVRIIT